VKFSQILIRFDDSRTAEEVLGKIRGAVDVTWVRPGYLPLVKPAYLSSPR